jgi:putative tryptophan/tyrosine transport system substrate-binding protein
MRRREFMAGVTCLATGIRSASAQPSLPSIGWLNPRSAETGRKMLEAFRQGLGELGLVEGRNVTIQYRWVDGNYARFPLAARELAELKVATIVVGSPPGVSAAKAATSTIPIVFASGGDPVAAGFVTSLSRPGGNVTGAYVLATELEAKRLEVLRELVPVATSAGVLVNPTYAETDATVNRLTLAARALGLSLVILTARDEAEIQTAFATAARQKMGALVAATDPFFNSRHEKIVALAASFKMPCIYPFPEYVEAGGLMSYGTSLVDAFRQSGIYAARIVRGEKPADLPVVQSAKVELLVNLKTARALGVTFPPTLLARADEVIE